MMTRNVSRLTKVDSNVIRLPAGLATMASDVARLAMEASGLAR